MQKEEHGRHMQRQITRSQLIYHRGRHGLVDGIEVAENSREALALAVAEGAEWIEFDVQESLNIAHDPDNTGGSLKLPEALDIIAGRSKVVLDIKDPLEAQRAGTVVFGKLGTDGWTPEHFIFSSFEHETVFELKRRFGGIRAALIMDAVPSISVFDLSVLRKAGIENLHLDWMNTYMDAHCGYRFRNAVWRNTNIKLWVWTVNDKKRANFILNAYRAEKVFTDRPDILMLPQTNNP